MLVNVKVTGGFNIEWGQIDPKVTGGLNTILECFVFMLYSKAKKYNVHNAKYGTRHRTLGFVVRQT